MILGVNTLTDVQATINRCKQLDTERVSISRPSLPGFEENGYPDLASLREIKCKLEVVKDASWRLLKWPPHTISDLLTRRRYESRGFVEP